MTSAAARSLSCPTCGAHVPLAVNATARCLYCLEVVDVPAGIVRDLKAEAALDADATDHLVRLAEARGRAGRLPLFGIVVGVAVLAIAVLAVGGIVHALPEDVDSFAYLSIAIVAVAYGGLVAVFVGGSYFSRRKARLRIAALPVSRLDVGETLTARCPGCGSTLSAVNDIGATCDHCGTDALLPAALVPAQLQRRHRQILSLKYQRGRIAALGAPRDVDATAFAGYVFIGLGVLLATGCLVWFAVARPGTHLPLLGEIAVAIGTAAMLGGIFVGGGLMSLRSAGRLAPPSAEAESQRLGGDGSGAANQGQDPEGRAS